MLNFIKGTVADKIDGMIVVETAGGMGFEIRTTDNVISSVRTGEYTSIYVCMIVREDDISLYGFSNKSDQMMFKELIKISGIGAKGALSLLNELKSDEIRNAIAFQHPEELARANGIGKKTAQRIVLELGEKMGKISVESSDIPIPASADAKTEALEALVALGYSRAESLTVLSSADIESNDVEEYIKFALKNIK